MKINKIGTVKVVCGVLAAFLSTGCSGNLNQVGPEATFPLGQPQISSIAPTVIEAPLATSAGITESNDTAQVAPWDTPTVPILADFTPAKLWSDYKADPASADAKYYGDTFIWKNVVIEDMAPLFKPCDAVTYVLNNLVYFRTDNKTDIKDLKVGYVVDIQGTVMGPMQNFVLVEHCKFNIVDTTNGITRPDWITVFG